MRAVAKKGEDEDEDEDDALQREMDLLLRAQTESTVRAEAQKPPLTVFEVHEVHDSDEESSVEAEGGGRWVPPKVHPLLKELAPSVVKQVRFVCVFVCDHAVASYNWYCFILRRLRLMPKRPGAGEALTLSP